MVNANPLMLVRIAQGDAYGAAVEFIKRPRDEHIYEQALRFTRYLKHPTHSLYPGQYTDDTQMSIAVAEVLLEDQWLDKSRFAEAFVRCFKRDRRDGYARGFQAFLESIASGEEFLKKIEPKSDKNGAAMRSVPLGVLPLDQVVSAAALQASITHNTVGGIQSSILVAMMSHFALWETAPFKDLHDWLNEHCNVNPFPWEGGPVIGPDIGMRTADAVFTLLSTESTLLGMAKTAIEWGGDVDSVLAIAWGIASARMHEPLPAFFNAFENGTYGRDFLAELGGRLMNKFTVPTPELTDTQKTLA